MDSPKHSGCFFSQIFLGKYGSPEMAFGNAFPYCSLFVRLKVSVDFLNELGVPFIKIGSGDVTNGIVMQKVATAITQRPLVVSTGMTDMEDVKEVYNLVSSKILSCN